MAIDINIPSQVKNYANLAAFPATGALKTIYIAEDTNKTYRWTGSAYVEISATAASTWGAIGGTLSSQTDLQTALNAKITGNTAITGATKTKITYDSKGLVTAGADATTADIADSLNKRYVTDANLTVIGNTSGTNTGDNATNTQYSGLATSKQDALVSGTNIKTVNGTTILGSGDLTISTGITIGTTAITSGTVGRVLFEGTGNVVQESANLFWDNTNGRLGIGTSSPSAIIHSVGSVTASGLIGRGNFFNNTLVASANNDVLVGLDLQPTFTLGAFTGTNSLALRTQGNVVIGASTYTTLLYSEIPKLFVNGGSHLLGTTSIGPNRIYFSGNNITWENTGITNNLPEWRADATGIKFGNFLSLPLRISVGGVENARFFSTGNVGINTTTDAGFKLDVNGTARVVTSILVGAGSTQGTIQGGVFRGTYFNDYANNFTIFQVQSNGNASFYQGLAIGTSSNAVASAQVEIVSTTKGFLPPRQTQAQRTAISSPAIGLQVYQTDGTEGLYIYKSTGWALLL
jgi:hypothetical protein